MKNKSLAFYLISFLISIVTAPGCKPHFFRSNYQDANKLLHETTNIRSKPFLKAHLKNGDVCILNAAWQIDTTQNIVSGPGTRYDFNRSRISSGEISIGLNEVALFETNKRITDPEAGRITALSILTGLDIAVGIFCITNPKACYGSCPTFYQNESDNFHYADAEGFSNAIVPSLEYADIDALHNPQVINNSFSITMKNEALETHCIKDVKLLACSREKGERVYQSPDNSFYVCENNYPIQKALAEEGDITVLLQKDDRQERFSLADARNLSSKETIYLDFANVKNPQDLGIILNFRQTLMTTYLFYSAMGYMGEQVADLFTRLETEEDTRAKFDATTKELGKIDIYRWHEQKKNWELQEHFYETGPIAINRQLLPLKNMVSGENVKLKLVINKGLWRLDYLALTNIKKKAEPLEISPESLLNKGKTDPAGFAALLKPDKYLISMPGSAYKLNFKLPAENQEYELFLYSKGYYLEWMREHWIKDKNLLKLNQMVKHPKRYLKSEARDFKRYESSMEAEFWNSRIDTKSFSLYED